MLHAIRTNTFARSSTRSRGCTQVVGGAVVCAVVPPSGPLAALLAEPTAIVDDPRVAACRAANPDDS